MLDKILEGSLMDRVLRGQETPEAYIRLKRHWEVDHEGKTLEEYLGISTQEQEEITAGRHSFRFMMFRYKFRKILAYRAFPGAYIQFISERELGNPILEYGWIDHWHKGDKHCVVQCDDCWHGAREVDVRLEDILRILPLKERPNIFYKAMLCGNCQDCSQNTGEVAPNCRFAGLFADIKHNRMQGCEIISEVLKK